MKEAVFSLTLSERSGITELTCAVQFIVPGSALTQQKASLWNIKLIVPKFN